MVAFVAAIDRSDNGWRYRIVDFGGIEGVGTDREEVEKMAREAVKSAAFARAARGEKLAHPACRRDVQRLTGRATVTEIAIPNWFIRARRGISEGDLGRLRVWASRNPVIVAVWLYGSRARGTDREDSDLDLAVVVRGETSEARLAAWAGADWRSTLKLSAPIHLEWLDEGGWTPTVEGGAKEDGIILYSAMV